MRRPLHFILPLLAAAALVACRLRLGQRQRAPAAAAPSGSSGTSTPAAKKIKVGLVTDIGGLNDRSFNQLANAGPHSSAEKTSASRAAC